MSDHRRINTLFVCSRNRWRSPTAERIFRDDARLNVRSRGVSRRAVRPVSPGDLHWADLVLVMEAAHQSRLQRRFGPLPTGTTVRILEIPDEFEFMDPELIDLLRDRVEHLLGETAPRTGLHEPDPS